MKPFKIKNSYADLPKVFYQKVKIPFIEKSKLLALNEPLSEHLNLNLTPSEIHHLFSGRLSTIEVNPIAQAYAGHQFGHFNPALGDGRALLIGEVQAKDSKMYDIQLKGAGQTQFSRSGDGKSPLGPVIREYIVSEAMNKLGIPTTRSLAILSTGESVYRDAVYPGAVLARVASSHIRIGTFQYFLARQDKDSLKILTDYAIDKHYPEVKQIQSPYLEFFARVCTRLNQLVCEWMRIGFIHGVMNTDNMSISGETIDYGPCSFMENYDPKMCLSFVDREGRYCYENQPAIMQWNLTRFAECLLPLVSEDETKAQELLIAKLEESQKSCEEMILKMQGQKVGIIENQNLHQELIFKIFESIRLDQLDFTLAFHYLSDLISQDPKTHFYYKDAEHFHRIYEEWQSSVLSQKQDREELGNLMKSVNPALIPRNHVIEQVIDQAYEDQLHLFHKTHETLKTPYLATQEALDFLRPAKENEKVRMTFCGT